MFEALEVGASVITASGAEGRDTGVGVSVAGVGAAMGGVKGRGEGAGASVRFFAAMGDGTDVGCSTGEGGRAGRRAQVVASNSEHSTVEYEVSTSAAKVHSRSVVHTTVI